MSKRRLCLLSVIVLGLMVLFSFSTATASPHMIPPLPSSFYGTVKDNGENVPVGTTISAWINGVQYGETDTLLYNQESVYAVDVPGDDPSSPGIIEGGIQGDIIVFKIGVNVADQTAIWQTGTNNGLNLSRGLLPEKIYLPLILH